MQATELRLAGNAEARSGNSEQAVELYSRALELDPPSGKHLLLSNRSGVLLSTGRSKEAATDADEAANLAPVGFRNAYIRQVRAFLLALHTVWIHNCMAICSCSLSQCHHAG